MKNQTSRYHYSLFHLTWPVFLEMVLQIMVGSVDQLMMSQFSQVGVTAIGNANQIITFVLLLFNIVSSGGPHSDFPVPGGREGKKGGAVLFPVSVFKRKRQLSLKRAVYPGGPPAVYSDAGAGGGAVRLHPVFPNYRSILFCAGTVRHLLGDFGKPMRL